ncbi:MAG TPA: MgtC/SapB family protein [Planctomycetota bacterium]|nr:MgtC/SapB family protein [Planctomycetota bacterium]
MTEYEPFISLGVALGAGLLVGMQREQAALAEGGREDRYFVGGIRTYPLYALAGVVSTLLARQLGMWIIVAVFAAMVAPLLIAYASDVRNERDRGITSEIAFVITFLLGVLAAIRGVMDPPATRYLVVAATAVTLTTLLSLKEPLHALARSISIDDVYATVKFLILAVIVLPLLPNEAFGPYKALNPFHIGLMIVLMAALGFIGYVLIRSLGAGRGLALTGLVGGLVSSTVVTLAFSGRAKRSPEIANACALAVVLASTIMLIRVLILIAVVFPPLMATLIMPVAVMILAGLAGAGWFYYRGDKAGQDGDEVKFHNPFELGLALKFGLLFALVLLASKAALEYFGQSGVYAAAVLAGLTDMDAITLSMADLAKGGLDHRTAATGILLGAASNTAVKAGLAISLGGWLFGKKIAAAFALMIAAGAATVAILWFS